VPIEIVEPTKDFTLTNHNPFTGVCLDDFAFVGEVVNEGATFFGYHSPDKLVGHWKFPDGATFFGTITPQSKVGRASWPGYSSFQGSFNGNKPKKGVYENRQARILLPLVEDHEDADEKEDKGQENDDPADLRVDPANDVEKPSPSDDVKGVEKEDEHGVGVGGGVAP
jgi:hypothetical protein